MISIETLPKNGAFGVAILIPYVALFCFVAASVLVLPVMALWPHLRQPGYPIAAMWGAVSASVAAALVDYRGYVRWYPMLAFGVTGLASGLLYARLARTIVEHRLKTMPFRYQSGEAIKEGDRVLWAGQPGEVEFVADPIQEPDHWFIREDSDGGVMIRELEPHAFGRVLLPTPGDDEDLIFVSRRSGLEE